MKNNYESSKTKSYSARSIINKMDGYTFRFDNPNQRQADQWALQTKSQLISDILQNNKLQNLTFAEQYIDDVCITWNLDGKQRCATVRDFYYGNFKISKLIPRYEIGYQTIITDDKGNPELTENGVPKYEQKTLDIRGKKYSDLPKELQDRFLDYNFTCDIYQDCTNEDIEYHIMRYNGGKSMTKAQKAMPILGTTLSTKVKEISAMPFFKDCGDYKVSDFRNGKIDQVVIESIAACFYLDNWKGKGLISEFLRENATDQDFENLTDIVNRMEDIVTEDVSDLFTTKNTCVFFAIFNKFTKYDIEDKKFLDFLRDFKKELSGKVIDGVSFNEVNDGKNSKDKSMIVTKIFLIENLMKEYFHLDKPNVDEWFISDAVGIDQEEVKEDMALYNQSLDDLEDRVISKDSRLLEKKNRPSLLAIVAYMYKEDIDLEEWLSDYVKRNDMYFVDQKKNYLHMLDDLNGFLEMNKVAS